MSNTDLQAVAPKPTDLPTPEYRIRDGKDALDVIVDRPRGDGKKVYDPEILLEMQRKGLPKPEDCTQAQWKGPKRALGARTKLVAYLKANGKTNVEVANELDITPGAVSRICGSTLFKEYVNKIHYQQFGKRPDDQFKEILPEAVKVARDILHSDAINADTRASVAFKFMDRALGKPKQQVEVQNSLIRELFAQMDAINRSPHTNITIHNHANETLKAPEDITNVEFEEITEPEETQNNQPDNEEKDEIDLFVQEHLNSDKKDP